MLLCVCVVQGFFRYLYNPITILPCVADIQVSSSLARFHLDARTVDSFLHSEVKGEDHKESRTNPIDDNIRTIHSTHFKALNVSHVNLLSSHKIVSPVLVVLLN
jgi:hypothetical protein